MNKALVGIIAVFFLLAYPVIAEESYVYVDKLKHVSVPAGIYQIEKNFDFFDSSDAPAKNMSVIPVDLDGDGVKEFFVSNPYNNALFVKFWRLYKPYGKGYNLLSEMSCSSIRVSDEKTDGYKNFECFTYISSIEGNLIKYRFFGDQYYTNSKNKVDTRVFYTDDYPQQKK